MKKKLTKKQKKYLKITIAFGLAIIVVSVGLAVAKKIIEHEIDSIPVVENIDGKTRVVGKISKTNITRLFLEIVDN